MTYQIVGAPPSLPVGYISIKYPGYFWHVPSQTLWSMKVTGVLKPLPCRRIPPAIAQMYGLTTDPCYQISVNGRKRRLRKADLERQYVNYRATIPTVKEIQGELF
jgi:hypothetical protein